MKKLFLSCLLSVLYLSTALSADYSGTCSANLTWTLNASTGVLTISGTGPMDDYDSHISRPWNSSAMQNAIKSIVLVEGVTTIGNYAFKSLSKLTSVSFPSTLTRIGDRAFDGSRHVTISQLSGNYSIGENAFHWCDAITNLTISGNVKIGRDAFNSCDGLQTLILMDHVVVEGNNAFDSCDRLKAITFGGQVSLNGSYVFQNCDSITTVTFQEGTKTLPEGLFARCPMLSNVSMPSTLDSIKRNAFERCDSLKSITLPNDLKYIGIGAFDGCGLKSITIPGNTTAEGRIGSCQYLETATVYGTDQTYSLLFEYCSNLQILYWHVREGSSAGDPIGIGHKIKEVYIGEEVELIPSKLCNAFVNLEYVEVQKNVERIGAYAFQNCPKLKNIRIHATTPPWIGLYGFFMTAEHVESVIVPCNSVSDYQNANYSNAYGWGNMNIVGDDNCTEPPIENSTFWNISDAAFNSLGTITSTKTINGLTIKATSDKAVTIDADAREIDGLSFTHRLKFGGTGASDARLLSFQVNGDSDIDVYLMSASSSADRTLNVDKGSFGNNLQQLAAPAGVLAKGTVHYTGSATTIYLYSPSSGLNIYAIRVTEKSSSSTTSYTVSVSSANSSMGTVSGGGQYDEGATATVTATPKSGYKFTKWSNGSTANPYSFTVTQNVSLTAYFEQSSTPQQESKFWNISDAAFNSLGTISSNKTINGLTIYATSSKNVVIDESAQEIDGLSFTHRLKFGGTGASDSRLLSFPVNGDCDIDIYLMSASGTADRTLNVDKGSFGKSWKTIPALGASISKGTVHYTGSATTIYLYSPSSGVYIYAIRLSYGNNQDIKNPTTGKDDKAQKILYNGQIFILRGDKTYTITGAEVK